MLGIFSCGNRDAVREGGGYGLVRASASYPGMHERRQLVEVDEVSHFHAIKVAYRKKHSFK